MRAKTWSLYMQMPMFAVLEAANFAVPEVTVEAEWLWMVEEAVSRVFAVR